MIGIEKNSNKEWGKIKPLLSDNKEKKRHLARDHQIIIKAILWVLRTGAPWHDIPQEFCPLC